MTAMPKASFVLYYSGSHILVEESIKHAAIHLPGGKGEEEEDEMVTLVRELREELGWDYDILRNMNILASFRLEAADYNNTIYVVFGPMHMIDSPFKFQHLHNLKYENRTMIFEKAIAHYQKQTIKRFVVDIKDVLNPADLSASLISEDEKRDIIEAREKLSSELRDAVAVVQRLDIWRSILRYNDFVLLTVEERIALMTLTAEMMEEKDELDDYEPFNFDRSKDGINLRLSSKSQYSLANYEGIDESYGSSTVITVDRLSIRIKNAVNLVNSLADLISADIRNNFDMISKGGMNIA